MKPCSIKVGDLVAAVWDEPSPGDSGLDPVTVVKVYRTPKSGWWIKADNGCRFSEECVVETFERAEATA